MSDIDEMLEDVRNAIKETGFETEEVLAAFDKFTAVINDTEIQMSLAEIEEKERQKEPTGYTLEQLLLPI